MMTQADLWSYAAYLCGLVDSVKPHPLDPRWKPVLYGDSSAALEARQVLPTARHRHRARRLGPRVHSVIGITYRTSGLQLEK